MRSDMAKVLVERPRQGGDVSKSRQRDYDAAAIRAVATDDLWFDEPAANESMRRRHGYGRKSLNENLNPLQSFLQSRIGQPWNDVYSELREHLDSGSAVKMHVIEHLDNFVEKNTAVVDGVVGYHTTHMWKNGRRGAGFEPIVECYSDLYVHPISLKLARVPKKSGVVRIVKSREVVAIDAMHQYRMVGGIWYWVRLEKWIQNPRLVADLATDAVYRTIGSYDRARRYGSADLCAAEKRQAGRKELRHIAKLLAAKPKPGEKRLAGE